MYRSRFDVKNFRCFKDLQINDLGRVNLIAGKNNTGKTALHGGDVYVHSRPNRDSQTLLRIDRRGSYRTFRAVFSIAPMQTDDLNTIVSWRQFVFYEMDPSSEPIELIRSQLTRSISALDCD